MEVEAKGFRLDLSRAQWFKSTRSGPNSDNCVEVAFVDEAIVVRDSKNPGGPALIFTAARSAFLRAVAIPSSDKSKPVTSHPFNARKTELRPCPIPMSKARPGLRAATVEMSKALGSVA